jgi:hypothetical protein
MTEINLLPWREQARVRRKKVSVVFFVFAFVAVLLMARFYFREDTPLPVSAPAAVDDKKSERLEAQLKKLKFAGFLQENNRSWGLIMLPDGKTHDVRVGTVLAIGHARVLSITADDIVLQLENQRQIVLHSS